ncbi:hypothetical protein BGZ49_004231 [Haplosporangium sp. Z 27]|nr:hypothetical protein BGZ49_004231 [Haplosporangium sp. Z 27]
MFGRSNAWIRQVLIFFCIIMTFILSLIIMGCVGVHGKLRLGNGHKGCILYMDIDNGNIDYNNSNAVYNNGFCLFPLVGAAVIAGLTFIITVYLAITLSGGEEVNPRPIAYTITAFILAMTLLAFSICAEIGIGLNKGCKILPQDQRHNCRRRKRFNALWAAEICAGLSGGFLLIAFMLEMFQLMLPANYSSKVAVDSSYNDKTTVPSTPVVSTPQQYNQQQFSQPQYLTPNYQTPGSLNESYPPGNIHVGSTVDTLPNSPKVGQL